VRQREAVIRTVCLPTRKLPSLLIRVTLGQVPAWVVAVGPPLVVAVLVFTTNVLRFQRRTPRWGA
jgi:hypothetical protein